MHFWYTKPNFCVHIGSSYSVPWWRVDALAELVADSPLHGPSCATLMSFCMRQANSRSWHDDPYVCPSLPHVVPPPPALSASAQPTVAESQMHRGPPASTTHVAPYRQARSAHDVGADDGWSDSTPRRRKHNRYSRTDTNISQGRVAKLLRCGGIFIAQLLLSDECAGVKKIQNRRRHHHRHHHHHLFAQRTRNITNIQ